MSVHVMTWVLRHSPAELGTRLVLLSLADHASADGTDAWAAVATLKSEANLKSRRTTQTALRELEIAKAIAPAGKGPRGTTNWTVSMDLSEQDWLAAVAFRKANRRGANIAPAGGADIALAGAQISRTAAGEEGGANIAPARISPGATVAPKPSNSNATSSPSGEDVAASYSTRTSATQQGEGDEREVARLKPELRGFVEPVRQRLADVAADRPGSIAPTTAAVARLLARFPRKDFIPLADDFAHWSLHGRGRGRRVRDVVQTYRNWIAKEPDVLRPTPVPGANDLPGRRSQEQELAELKRRLAEADR